MANLMKILPSVFAAVLAFLAYRYVIGVRSYAKKSGSYPSVAPGADKSMILEAHRASDFPEDWWIGESLFNLERRALFSKVSFSNNSNQPIRCFLTDFQQWIYIAHRSQFAKPGDYHTFELANFPIFLILGKDHVIRGFHNVCRHRAYTITKKKSGSSTVLGCRYHGWSYDTRGRLVKAPAFEDIENFDKSQNGLFEIHTHTTRQGFVYVNLSTDKVSSPDVKTKDILARSWGISERSAPLAQVEVEEDLNWKQAGNVTRFKPFPLASTDKTLLNSALYGNSWLCS